LGNRLYAYIDGFNLYHGALKKSRYKWLDLTALCERLMTGWDVAKVKYFTAKVRGFLDPDQPKRQQDYWDALKTCYPDIIEIIPGHFSVHLKPYPMAYSLDPKKLSRDLKKKGVLPERACEDRGLWWYASQTFVDVIKPEEKGTDVNLAIHMLDDAWEDKYDAALVVSNDSDLIEAIKMVKDKKGKEVFWANPYRRSGKKRVGAFRKLGLPEKKLWRETLKNCQLPDEIPDTEICRPATW